MYKNDIEKLTDELIGQAVLLLLKRNVPVNSMALLTQLRAMQATETERSRRDDFPSLSARIEAATGKQTKLTQGEHRENARWRSRDGSRQRKRKVH